jgi:hypothetical protein
MGACELIQSFVSKGQNCSNCSEKISATIQRLGDQANVICVPLLYILNFNFNIIFLRQRLPLELYREVSNFNALLIYDLSILAVISINMKT